MTITSSCRIAAAAVILVAGTSAWAEPGTRSAGSLPPLPAASNHASDKSNGLPNADGHKPGNGNGHGHDDGKGHDIGRGHGHDDDHNASPG